MSNAISETTSFLWTDRSTEFQMTGTWRSSVPQYHTLVSPCHTACPMGGEIATWIHQITQKDYHGAWLTLMENNPFPAITGRICHHPCQASCNRAEMDETVGICSLERVVGDMALAEGWSLPTAKTRKSARVAVVGSGPAGLSAAYQLMRAGYGVTVFEARAQSGGLLRYGIPAYRLERRVLDGEIARLVDMGLELRLNSGVGDAASLKALRAEYDAVYLATGAARPKHLPGLDYGQPHVMDGAEFLAATNGGAAPDIGARVLVIGGGSAALDVARSARRLGREVTVMSLEPEGHLPAQAGEITEARDEGIEFVSGAMLERATPLPEGVEIACTRVTFTADKARGTFRVSPVENGGFSLVRDTVITAIGQDAETDQWGGMIPAKGGLALTGAHGETASAGIYAGGDLTSTERFVSHAIGMGKQAAQAIGAAIEKPADTAPTGQTGASFDAINTAYQTTTPRHRQANTAPDIRRLNFDEVQQPLDLDAALAEAQRCFSCGACIFCDNCFYYCPDMAITRLGNGYEVKTDYCKGCGLCVAECPTGAVQMYAEVSP